MSVTSTCCHACDSENKIIMSRLVTVYFNSLILLVFMRDRFFYIGCHGLSQTVQYITLSIREGYMSRSDYFFDFLTRFKIFLLHKIPIRVLIAQLKKLSYIDKNAQVVVENLTCA